MPAARDSAPLLVAVDMGYGHLRAARAVGDHLGVEVLEADRPPLAGSDERAAWGRVRAGYELLSRTSQIPFAGRPLRRVLDNLTAIEDLYPRRDLSRPTLPVVLLEQLARRGLGKGLLDRLAGTGGTLVSTFFAPPIVADLRGLTRIVSVVTDSDINRVWAPRRSAATKIHFCAPTERAARRLAAYGVPEDQVHMTGFPLPPELIGGPELEVLRANLARRLVRLDPRGTFRRDAREELTHFLGPLPDAAEGQPPLVTFAVGGAGAQSGTARAFLPALRPALLGGRVRLALVAGLRREIAARFRAWLAASGLGGAPGVEILESDTFPDYYARFNALLARTDVLWTKPSELTFYAALGLPLVFSRPVGVHERANRKWARHRGAGLKQEHPGHTWDWLSEWLADGTLAGAAWAGYTRLPKFGSFRVRDVIESVMNS